MLKTLFEDVLDFLLLLKWTIPFLFDEFRFLFLIWIIFVYFSYFQISTSPDRIRFLNYSAHIIRQNDKHLLYNCLPM